MSDNTIPGARRRRLRLVPGATLVAGLAVVLLGPVAGAGLQAQETSAGRSDAFADPGARELVDLARIRRATVDLRISRYEVDVNERTSIRARFAGVEKLVFRRETATHIEWSPDTLRVEVRGAREVQPMASSEVGVPPASLAAMVPALAFDPMDSEMLLRLDSTVILNPLGPGGEAHYRFASGDSTVIRLPDGREVRLLELLITARRADPRLINGAFWLDADTHAVVRAGFRLSRPRSASGSSVSFLQPEVTLEVDHIAIEYGLWDLEWWLPRSLVARGVVHAPGFRFPVAYERRYGEYQVQGSAPGEELRAFEEGMRPCRSVYSGVIALRSGGPIPADSTWEEAWGRSAERAAERAAERSAADTTGIGPGGIGPGGCDRAVIVSRAEGNLALADAFDWDIHDADEGPLGPGERAALADMVSRLPTVPWGFAPPRVQLLPVDAIRFNRVEGVSAAARATLPLGPLDLRGELRTGTSLEWGGRIAGARSTARLLVEGGGYREVVATAVPSHPFSPAGSLSSLILGRDENDYFRATGVDLRLGPPVARAQPWEMRLFAERQQPLEVGTQASLRALVDSDFETRPNLRAEAIDQVGVTLALRRFRGDDRSKLRMDGELLLHGETGDRTFGRPMVRATLQYPLPGDIQAGLAVSAGLGPGDLPIQRLWQIGGAATVRGQDPAVLRGERMYLVRGELLRGGPALGLAAFADAGWAGSSEPGASRPVGGVGIGLSLYDHSLRIDLAHGIRGGGLRAYVRLGAGL
ncbi:MAG: hypothetical protein EA350_04340 [Gemmatimonadales bacterium]|nr:MAG: hypothetical protein EA350_04340 [Gemmatimonadales bacterium]